MRKMIFKSISILCFLLLSSYEKTRKIIIILTLMLSFPFYTACEKTISGNIDEQNGDGETSYYLYVGNQGVTSRYGGNKVFFVDTNINTVVDSIGGFQDIINLKSSKSGEKLYVITDGVDNRGKIHVIDVKLRTQSLLLTDVDADVFTAPDGQVFLIVYERHSADAYLGRIDTRTDEIAFFDTLDIRFGLSNDQTVAFDTTRKLLYGVNNREKLFAYNYQEKKIVRTYDDILVPKSMVISPGGKYIYIAGGPVVDLERGEAIAGVGGNVLGSMALSPDGKLLYITDPGRYSHGLSFPTGKFYVYDTRTYRYIAEIDVSKESSGLVVSDWIVLAADGKIAYVSDWPESVLVVDLRSRQVLDTINFRFAISPIAIGEKP